MRSFSVADTVSLDQTHPVIAHLAWQPGKFNVDLTHHDEQGIARLRFPSPLPQGNKTWDTVLLDWHAAIGHDQQPRRARAVLVLDILHGGNFVAGYIARAFARNSIHAFVLHMPHAGWRRNSGEMRDWSQFLPSMRQATADARRARDVIAALPSVTGPVGLQGTSLGGFIATSAGSIDNAFDPVLLALTGGDIFGILTTGKVDAAHIRQRLLQVGYDDQKLHDALWPVEPLRIADRLNPDRTWLHSAKLDQVVPARFSQKLAATIGLAPSHHRQLSGCHYTCVINAAKFVAEIIAITRGQESPRQLLAH